MSDYIKILRRTGVILLVVGVIDIGITLYCIANRIPYASSFNVFAVIAGIFLLRGSLRAAVRVRWFAAFFLGALLSMCLAWPFFVPWDLGLTELRLNPPLILSAAGFALVSAGLLFWLGAQLGDASVLAAEAAAGHPPRNVRVAAGLGVGLVVLVTTLVSVALGGESARKATVLAAQQVGPGYQFHVRSLTIRSDQSRTAVNAVVIAWNHSEVRNVRVGWEEQ